MLDRSAFAKIELYQLLTMNLLLFQQDRIKLGKMLRLILTINLRHHLGKGNLKEGQKILNLQDKMIQIQQYFNPI